MIRAHVPAFMGRLTLRRVGGCPSQPAPPPPPTSVLSSFQSDLGPKRQQVMWVVLSMRTYETLFTGYMTIPSPAHPNFNLSPAHPNDARPVAHGLGMPNLLHLTSWRKSDAVLWQASTHRQRIHETHLLRANAQEASSWSAAAPLNM